MQDTRTAMVDVLVNDTILMGLLGEGVNSIINERDVTPSTGMKYPFIVITFQGARPFGPQYPHLFLETWTFRVYDQENGYNTISTIQERIKKLLHRAVIDVATDPTLPSNQQKGILDINWVWYTPDYYDPDFKAENAGVRFHVMVIDQNQSFAS